jgi:cyclopropane fatty-acyl-phospholipid synthase-like methyltransferase
MWDEVYDTQDYVYGIEPNDFLKEHADKLPKGKVLCLAEGEGRNAVFLAELGYEVTAVDSSIIGLEKAEKLANHRGVSIKIECVDLADYEIEPNHFDVIVSIYCHLPSALRKTVYKKVQSGLVTGGVFLVEGYTTKQLQYKTGGPPNPDMMLSCEILQQELPELRFDLLEEKEREVLEGLKHMGVGYIV